jgi:D-aminoacyl-tRNA deacylase
MRALVQRVSRARVTVDRGRTPVGDIGPGLCVLVGVTHDDTPERAARLAERIWNLRIMDDDDGVMNLSVADTTRSVLVVSQFTLYGDTSRGRRPSWLAAAPPEVAEPLYERFCERLDAACGVFGAHMEVELVNDGPVTILLESS